MNGWILDLDPKSLKTIPMLDLVVGEIAEPNDGAMSVPPVTPPLPTDGDDEPISSARARLAEKLDQGARCPCCGRVVRVYAKTMSGTMAVAVLLLAWLHDERPELRGKFVHIGRLVMSLPVDPRLRAIIHGDTAKLAHWGLLESGSKGYHRLTKRGLDFARGLIKIPASIVTYDDTFLGFEGDPIDIYEALGDRFNLRAFEYNQVVSAIDNAYDVDSLAALETLATAHPESATLLGLLYERFDILADIAS